VDELQEFCGRVLGPGSSALQAAARARMERSSDRVELLAAAARACREQADAPQGDPGGEDSTPNEEGLASAVARELAQASARLPERQREALALRELLGLSHQQVARAMGIDAAAVAPLMARARLRLRAERRGVEAPAPGCMDRERALRALACRQDSEPLTAQDDAWLLEHLAECEGCEMAHAAMLEASVCYRAWP
jgi:predicted RNA polymerase sigma factor